MHCIRFGIVTVCHERKICPPPEGIAPRGSGMTKPTTASILDGDPGRLEQAVEKEGGRATLRLKKDGQATVEEVVSHHSSIEGHGLKTTLRLLQPYIPQRSVYRSVQGYRHVI